MNIPQVPPDKAQHLIYGVAVFVAVFVVAHGVRPDMALHLAAFAAFAVGVGKEAVDAFLNYRISGTWKAGPHGVDPLDAVATIAGGALVALPVMLATGLLTFPKG